MIEFNIAIGIKEIGDYIESDKITIEISVPINNDLTEIYNKFIHDNFDDIPVISESEYYGLLLMIMKKRMFGGV